MTLPWLEQKNDGVLLRVRIQPRASKSQLAGLIGEPARLKIRISAPPVDGEANEEVVCFLSKLLSIPKSAITIVRGQTAKAKDIFCAGISTEQAKGLLEL
jgi:uncharacterized protein (TIGR00251 family)